ncbi:hypothetical protein PQ478_11800 [Alkalihalophilus pseudofirmus]|uniref:hypothetical protein n=1 Tax=Alkalihalophilus pseudofirmus TaxID=79885 RepID=UPI000B1B1841|nr:hypothetical protein [Alkalihalophilus pseudofirmus]WEG15224.1 hypothetical protein PQ478_11800 [Alkalihalophilus pseudofirmus]
MNNKRNWALAGFVYVALVMVAYGAITGEDPFERGDFHDHHPQSETEHGEHSS